MLKNDTKQDRFLPSVERVGVVLMIIALAGMIVVTVFTALIAQVGLLTEIMCTQRKLLDIASLSCRAKRIQGMCAYLGCPFSPAGKHPDAFKHSPQ
jgi:hypothetical protein